jgi:alkylation response protein AidB-like acyl-CoA dehydrogenase
MSAVLDQEFSAWLAGMAEALDSVPHHADAVLPTLAGAGLLGAGVPARHGGRGGDPSEAVFVTAAIAEQSLAAAFVYWAQRVVIECVMASPNEGLVARLLPRLLAGELAGAPGLSNAMRALGGLGRMQNRATAHGGGMLLDGTIPWATNLRRAGFVAVVAAERAGEGEAEIHAVPHDAPGVQRQGDHEMLALRATHTAALRFEGVVLGEDSRLHPQASRFLPALRPFLLALQCGLGIGLARASLGSARRHTPTHSVLVPEIARLDAALALLERRLAAGLDEGGLRTRPADLIGLRIRMVDLANDAVQLELQALGARAYARGNGNGFARRLREAAFLPILTPTLVQLKTELARMPAPARAA